MDNNQQQVHPEQRNDSEKIRMGKAEQGNSLDAAIINAIRIALNMSVSRPCDKCGGKIANPYSFAFAKLLSATTTNDYGGYTATSTRTYGPVQAQLVYLCDTCIETFSRAEIRKSLALMVGAGIITLVLIILGIVFAGWREILLALAILPAIAVIGYLLQYLRLKKRHNLAGSYLAIDLYKDELKKQGLSYWADTENRL